MTENTQEESKWKWKFTAQEETSSGLRKSDFDSFANSFIGTTN